MKIRFVLSLAMMCFVGANVSAALVDLNPVEDSYIRWNTPDENYGTAGNLSIGQSFPPSTSESNPRKAYTLWDASSLNPADILSVEGIAFWSDKENTRSVALLLLAKDDGLDDNWSESTITWNTAPYNDVGSNGDRAFNPFLSLGELDPVLIGGFQVGLGSPDAVLDGNGNPTGYYAHQFTQAESDLLVAALKSDDHKVTIGLQYNSSHDDKFALKSKDADVSGVGPVPPILRLDVVLNSLAADFDGDDDVDGNDFLIWQSGFGVDDTGDADTDSDTDGDDLLIWKTEFGSADGAFSVVPEPTAGLLAILLFGLSAWYSRKYPARSQY